MRRFDSHKTLPLALVISLAFFIPVVAYVTLQATISMFKYVQLDGNTTYYLLPILRTLQTHIAHTGFLKYTTNVWRHTDRRREKRKSCLQIYCLGRSYTK